VWHKRLCKTVSTFGHALKMSNYVSGKIASEKLGVHPRTLYQWDEKGWIETIRTPGNKRLYNVEKFLKDREAKESPPDEVIPEGRQSIIYARVSSLGQKDDLLRQIHLLQKRYPTHTLIQDIGSGMNLNRRGFRKMLDLAIQGRIEEVVVAYKDRLARFGYELFEDLLKTYSNGTITVLSEKNIPTPESELVQDVLQIMNIFVAKMNGLRKYKKINT